VDEGWVSAPFSRAVTSELAASVETKEARIFKLKATTIIQEYFLSDDIGEVILSLEDLAAPDYHATFVKRLITLAMDRFASATHKCPAISFPLFFFPLFFSSHVR
jgi:programmed cell death protein 4